MIFPQDTQLISVLLIEIEKLWDLIIIFIIGLLLLLLFSLIAIIILVVSLFLYKYYTYLLLLLLAIVVSVAVVGVNLFFFPSTDNYCIALGSHVWLDRVLSLLLVP